MVDTGILGPDDRVELIEGEILTMSPEKSRHSAAVDLTADALRTAFPAGHSVRVQHPLALGQWSEPEPDVAVVVGTPRDYVDAHPASAVLVVEVADTSLLDDRGAKQRLYARAGIAEYWIVNLRDSVLEVYLQPEGDGYAWSERLSRDAVVAPVAAPAARIAVGDLLP
jgi:Uma2 family endonuclease